MALDNDGSTASNSNEPTYPIPEGVPSSSSPTAPSATPAPVTTAVPPTTATPAPTASATGAPAASATPGVDGQAVPYSRFKEVNDKSRTLERDLAIANAALETERKRVRGLAGLEPLAPAPDPAEQELRTALETLYPQLKQLSSIQFDKLAEMLNTVPQLQTRQAEADQKTFDRMADTTLAQLFTEAKTAYNGADLSPEQKQMLHAQFVTYVERNPDAMQRYLSGDTTLAPEFVQKFTETMLAPVRRATAATVDARLSRIATAPGGGSTGGPVGQTPPTLPKDGEALHGAAFAAFTERRQ